VEQRRGIGDPAHGRGLAATRAGLRGVDLNSGILGDVIVGANGKPVRRLADLTDQL
jgi:2-alkenal reductase